MHGASNSDTKENSRRNDEQSAQLLEEADMNTSSWFARENIIKKTFIAIIARNIYIRTYCSTSKNIWSLFSIITRIDTAERVILVLRQCVMHDCDVNFYVPHNI